MEGFVIGAAAAASIWASVAGGPPAACPATAPAVTVRELLPGVAVSRSLDSGGIAREMERGGTSAPARSVFRGMTRTAPSISLETAVTMSEVAGGGWCAWASEVVVSYGFRERIEVYVDSSLRSGTCALAATTEHELGHAEIGEESVRWGASGMRDALSALASPGIVGTGASAAEASADMRGRIEAELVRVDDLATRLAAQRNAAMDTPEAYRAFTAGCSDW